MKFKTYALFYVLFGVLPDLVISIFLAGGFSLLPVWLPTLAALWYLVLIRSGIQYTESLKCFSYLIFLFELPKLILCLLYLISRSVALSLGAGVAVSLFFAVMIFIVTTRIKTQEQVLAFPDLPKAFDGLKICHLSDFHLGSFGKRNPYIKRIVDTVIAGKPDLILFSGDLVNFSSSEADSYLSELGRLKAPLGVFSIRGNHDYLLHGNMSEKQRRSDTDRLLNIERSLGWIPLLNAHAFIRKGEDQIAIAGVENISANPYFPSMGGDLKKALEGISARVFTILLSHDPTHWKAEVSSAAPVALTLSGHTHGLKYKLAGPHPSSWKFQHHAGIFRFRDQVLHVSVGLGSSFAFRLGGRPCVDFLKLIIKPKT